MIDLRQTSSWAEIIRPVKPTSRWPVGEQGSAPRTACLSGPIVLDVYQALAEHAHQESFIANLVDEAERAATELHAWTPSQVKDMKSAAWRSAHQFIVQNIHLVDRGRELDELATLLKVK